MDMLLRNSLGLYLPLVASLLACGSSSTAPPASREALTRGAASTGTGTFAVLANAAATCTDGVIIGDIGTFRSAPPGKVTQTRCVLTGSVHIPAIDAYQAFLNAYAALKPKTTDNCPIITGTLAGKILPPGVYCVSSEAKTGVLTLLGNGNWTFKVPSGALTGTNFSVVFAGAPQPCNVTWWVDAATTMTTSNLKGNVLAGAAITFNGGTSSGSAFAGAKGVGDVTITGTAVTGCAGVGAPPPSCDGKDKDKCKCKHEDDQGDEHSRECDDDDDDGHHHDGEED
jgi:hypothetical protein